MDKYVESVIAKYRERSETGIKKYGTTLERKDLNLIDWLNHLQEELMDASLYVERLKEEPNDETLEEASWRYNPVKKLDGEFIRQAFIEGAKSNSAKDYWFKVFKKK